MIQLSFYRLDYLSEAKINPKPILLSENKLFHLNQNDVTNNL